MKRIMIIAAAASVLAGAAMAQDAYTSAQGAAPSDYPPCTKAGQDRCTEHGGKHMKGHRHMMKKAEGSESGKAAGGKTSKDGERG